MRSATRGFDTSQSRDAYPNNGLGVRRDLFGQALAFEVLTCISAVPGRSQAGLSAYDRPIKLVSDGI